MSDVEQMSAADLLDRFASLTIRLDNAFPGPGKDRLKDQYYPVKQELLRRLGEQPAAPLPSYASPAGDYPRSPGAW